MESLKLSFHAIMPIFLLMLFGYLLRQFKISDKKSFDAANRLVFRAFLPTLLFYNIYQTEAARVFDTHLITFVVVGVLAIFFSGYFAVLALTRDNKKRGVMLQGFFRSNYAILGIPLVNYICGGTSAISSLMVSVVVPLFNVLAVISLERFRCGKIRPFKLFIGILTNPLIIGCLLGLVFLKLGIRLPSVLNQAVSDISKIATPLAIIALGASVTFSGIRGYVRDIMLIVFVKLIFIPLIMLSFAVILGFRGEALACLLVVFASPVAVSSFSMAQQMGGDEKLAAQAVVMTSAFCLLTLFGWIFILNHLNLF